MKTLLNFRLTTAVLFSILSCLFLCYPVKAQTDQIIYADALQNNWENYSWANVNLNNPQPVHGGAVSASVSAGAYQAFYLHHASFSINNYLSLNFWVHGGASGGQRLQVQATSGGAPQTAVALEPLAANSWRQINIPLAALGVGGNTAMDGFWIQETTGATQTPFYVDAIKLVGGTPPPPPPNSGVTIAVNAALNNRAINPNIYGVAYASAAQLLDLNAPLNRLGGNNTSRYNWQLNADNRANDWYFQSIGFANTPGSGRHLHSKHQKRQRAADANRSDY